MTKYFVLCLLFIIASPLARSKLIKDIKKIKYIPKMIVFDLDYTLWPFRIDIEVDPPFHINEYKEVEDYESRIIKPYPETKKVLRYIAKNNITMCVASRNADITGAEQLIDLFGWNKYLINKQIYQGSKRRHIKTLSTIFNIGLKDMLLFDDECHNILDLEHMGVVSILVKLGMSTKVLMEGIKTYSDRRMIDQLPKRPPP